MQGGMKDAADMTCELTCDEVYELFEYLGWADEHGCPMNDRQYDIFDKLDEWLRMNVRSDNT